MLGTSKIPVFADTTYTLLPNLPPGNLGAVGVRRDADDSLIPADPSNLDWQAYQAWLAAGNTPRPAA